jgi:hypothetical protein
LKIYFLLSVLEISDAYKRNFGGNNDQGFNSHSGKGMKNEHGLLPRKFPKIE